MAIASVDAALAQYNANLDWNTSQASAQLALEAVRYLIVNQPNSYAVAGRSITKNLPQLEKEQEALMKFLGVGAPRAFGRSRRVPASFADAGQEGVQ